MSSSYAMNLQLKPCVLSRFGEPPTNKHDFTLLCQAIIRFYTKRTKITLWNYYTRHNGKISPGSKWTASGSYSTASAYKIQFMGCMYSNLKKLVWKPTAVWLRVRQHNRTCSLCRCHHVAIVHIFHAIILLFSALDVVLLVFQHFISDGS